MRMWFSKRGYVDGRESQDKSSVNNGEISFPTALDSRIERGGNAKMRRNEPSTNE